MKIVRGIEGNRYLELKMIGIAEQVIRCGGNLVLEKLCRLHLCPVVLTYTMMNIDKKQQALLG